LRNWRIDDVDTDSSRDRSLGRTFDGRCARALRINPLEYVRHFGHQLCGQRRQSWERRIG